MMLKRRERMRSWSASCHLQPDACKAEEERRVGASRHHNGNEMVGLGRGEGGGSSPHLQYHADKEEECEEECLVPPPT